MSMKTEAINGLLQDNEVSTMEMKDALADAMSKVLSQNIGEKSVPILAKRTTEFMRSIAQAKSELKADKLSALERRQKNERGVVRPQGTTIEKDRKLRKIATSGVVALFNAISAHQHHDGIQAEQMKRTEKEKVQIKSLSKENFLEMLHSKAAEMEPSEENKKTWDVLNEDMAMGATLKSWDKTEESEEESESFSNDDFSDSN